MTPEVRVRAQLHHALGDPLRLAIVDRLVLGDVAPDELSRELHVPTNLLAHHLKVLAAAGITEHTPSHGDRRRKYVRLVAGVLDRLAPTSLVVADSVLFVCTGNSARSQLAAALWRRRSTVPCSSAGSDPAAAVHPEAVRTAAAHGLDLSGAAPRGFDEISGDVGLVVTVCDLAREGGIPFEVPRVHWSIPDPVPTRTRSRFEDVYRQLEQRVAALAQRVVAA